MTIQVTCSCGKELRAKDRALGKHVRCPACKELTLVSKNDPDPYPDTHSAQAGRSTSVAETPTAAEELYWWDTVDEPFGKSGAPDDDGVPLIACPSCDSPVDKNATFCPSCGRLNQEIFDTLVQRVHPKVKIGFGRYCDSCDRNLFWFAPWCPGCGRFYIWRTVAILFGIALAMAVIWGVISLFIYILIKSAET